MTKEIRSIEDIKLMVDSFYGEVRKDPLLGPIFHEVIGDSWDEHMKRMYTFWQTVLLREPTYVGNPFMPHSKLPIERLHFQRWLKLFRETVNTLFTGEVAKEALWRADKMAEMFQVKLQYIRNDAANVPTHE